jgi:putative FmdB family regulatory protein
MPIYAYVCQRCGDEVEVMQSMADPPLKRCKKCRGALRRVFTPVGIAFKGSGFHKNDYGPKKKASDEKKPSSSESKTSESKGDTSSGATKASGE